MFASHLWVRAAAVMSGGAEEPSPVKAFLSPLNLVEYRNLLKEQGYDDPSHYKLSPLFRCNLGQANFPQSNLTRRLCMRVVHFCVLC